MSTSLLAMKRDASWYRRPRAESDASNVVDWIGKYHIAVDEFAACSGVPLADCSVADAVSVSRGDRCMRSGCKGRWP